MPARRHHPDDGQAGFTIFEAMVASLLLIIGLASTLTLVENAASTTKETRTREQATSLQREVVEGARAVQYDQLTPTAAAAAIRTRPALADASGTGVGWTVRRRDTTYTVAVGVCTVDDPRDGLGTQEAGVFCASGEPATADADGDGSLDGLASPTGTSCTSSCDATPADYKRLVSLVTWRGGRNVQSAQINSPGLSAAPKVVELAVVTAVGDAATTSLPVTVTTSGTTGTVGLYVDGASIGAATGGPTSWSGAWTLGPVTSTPGAQPASKEILDGSYELSAKAFNKYGQYGVTRTQVVVVNRRLAFAPAFVGAGRNGAAVEIEWSPAKERDSAGFQVDRSVDGGATWTSACARAVRTRCRDTAAPPAGSGATLKYSVVPFDRDASGQPRAGDRSAAVTITDPAPAVPAPPASLSATVVGADVRLTWTPPGGTVPADHYNVYRNGTGFDDRLTSVFVTGSDLSFTDVGAAGKGHGYWITAVNGQLGESTTLGPVP